MNVIIHSEHQPLLNRFADLSLNITTVTDITTLTANDPIIISDPKMAFSLLKNTQHVVMVLSDLPSYEEGAPLLTLGMRGYANTYMHVEHLQQALDTIRCGNVWFYPEFMQQLIQQATQIAPSTPHTMLLEALTEREQETALLVKEGLSNKEIASQLGITERTVKQHMSHIFEKLEVSDRFALAMLLK